jgi:hypothetical protein
MTLKKEKHEKAKTKMRIRTSGARWQENSLHDSVSEKSQSHKRETNFHE